MFPNICRREFVGVIAGLGGTYIRRTKAWLVDIEQKAYFLTDHMPLQKRKFHQEHASVRHSLARTLTENRDGGPKATNNMLIAQLSYYM